MKTEKLDKKDFDSCEVYVGIYIRDALLAHSGIRMWDKINELVDIVNKQQELISKLQGSKER